MDLAGKNDDGNACGETNSNRMGDMAHQRAHPKHAAHQHHHTRHHGGDEQAIHPVCINYRSDENNEGTRRTTDLETATAQS